MKKTEYDLLFALNHTAAMLRDNLKTLSRKTWCTAKKINRLRLLLYLYAVQHNRRLEEKEQKSSKR